VSTVVLRGYRGREHDRRHCDSSVVPHPWAVDLDGEGCPMDGTALLAYRVVAQLNPSPDGALGWWGTRAAPGGVFERPRQPHDLRPADERCRASPVRLRWYRSSVHDVMERDGHGAVGTRAEPG
jgi:hypothetical protein